MTLQLNMGSPKTYSLFGCKENTKSFEVQTMIGLIEEKLAVFITCVTLR